MDREERKVLDAIEKELEKPGDSPHFTRMAALEAIRGLRHELELATMRLAGVMIGSLLVLATLAIWSW